MQPTMKKMSAKLFIAIITLIIIVIVAVSVSYAWMTISSSPSISGAQVTIAGGTTILLAPDLTRQVSEGGENVTVHYPGEFSDNLIFSHYQSYDYLADLAGITPVSTADGVSWFMPTYDSASGALNDASTFTMDRTLEFANVTDPHIGGKYIYLDFWVVSPGSDYKVRVSADVKSKEGSSLLELPPAVEDEESFTGFSLGSTSGVIESIARVGFLANNDSAKDTDTLEYSRSAAFESRYRKLLGRYCEAGEEPDLTASNRFTIYEPNGTFHINPSLEQGEYCITSPLGYDAYMQTVYEADVSGILTVQGRNTWKLLNGERQLDQMFQAGISGASGLTTITAENKFYKDYLQNQVIPYITTAEFFTRTSTLYANATAGHVSALKIIENIATSGATDDVYITKLTRNTPQRIRMFIWLEGQDDDCSASSSGDANFVLNLELAGSDK